jgi:two-component system, OmpR family, phosphate regulon sensor histidine kinase PhoR
VSLGLRTKLLLASLVVVVLSVVAADTYLAGAIEGQMTEDIREDLTVRARLVEAEAVGLDAPSDDLATWDAFADRAGALAEGRVTLILPDGRVVGDSELSVADLASVENHAARVEVADAMSRGTGASTRYSTTIRQRMMYVAVHAPHGAEKLGAVRLAKPLVDVDVALARMRRFVLFGALVAIGAAMLFATLAAHWMSRTIRGLTDVARRMSAGDLDARARLKTKDEAGELGGALDQLAGGLSRALQDLRGERDRLARVLEGMREGVLLIDGEGRVALANSALRAMLLLQEVMGKTVLEIVRNADLKRLLDEAASSDEPVSGELELGELKPRRLLVHASRSGEDARGVLAVFVDVTDLRRLESLRRDFVANVSHELRTPVATVRAAAETLRRTVDTQPEVAAELVDIVERNAERLQRLVEDLLDLSRIESREYKLNLEPVEIGGVAEHIASLFRAKADDKRVKVRVLVPPDLDRALADRRALEQILTNLIDNAIKYGGEGGQVSVSGSSDEKSVRIVVSDDGPGVEAKHLPRLFERFYRVDAGRSRDVGGTGLGLSIVKHLAEAMRGSVSVESSPGKGTAFSVAIPRAS